MDVDLLDALGTAEPASAAANLRRVGQRALELHRQGFQEHLEVTAVGSQRGGDKVEVGGRPRRWNLTEDP